MTGARFTHCLDLSRFVWIGNPPYAGLSLADKRRRFLRVTFPSIEVRPDAEEAELRKLYDRLAFGGVPHEPSERAVTSVETA